MEIGRILRHLFTAPGAVRARFPPQVLAAIEAAITRTESEHGGELRFAVEGSLDFPAVARGMTARERALEVFSLLRMWDTAANNGVLIYVLLADHAVEIVADRGLTDAAATAPVAAEEWRDLCQAMDERFAAGDYEQGAVVGITAAGRLIARRFPAVDRNELPDTVVVL